MKTISNQRGDTIIEVLLAMAVLGMVLGTSFGIVNRSLATGRDAQERSEATKFAESQLEKLKTASSDPENKFFDEAFLPADSIYCVKDDLEADKFDNGTIQEDVDLTTYSGSCKAGPDGRYRLSIIRSGNVFTVRARWNSIRGDQLNEAKMTYRTYSYSSREYPVVSTDQSVSVTGPSATVTGRVTDQGKTVVSERGFIYNTVAGQHPNDGTQVRRVEAGIGAFSNILSLAQNTVYYVRAYATNGSGTSYGSEVQFTTQALQSPTVGPAIISNITTTSASISTTVSNGSSAITRQGIIIGLTNTLVLDNSRTINSTLGGSIAVTVGSLLPNTTYYVKTFATNSVGTTYSSVVPVSFKTSTIVSSIPLGLPDTFNGNTYYPSTQLATWAEAKAISAASGGHLVSITSAAENTRIATLVAGQGTWLGLNDRANEGVWVWDSGEPSGAGTYTNWYTGEPNNFFNGAIDEDVSVMNWSGGAWNDWYNNTTTRAYFVIEFDGNPMVNKTTVKGSSYSGCLSENAGYPCVTVGNSVYGRVGFRADYNIQTASGGPGYNTLVLDYNDFTAGAPTPPDSLYQYKVNIYINGVKTHDKYKLNPSGGIVNISLGLIPIPSISTVSIEWLNNEWVPVGSYTYDPDMQINNISVGYIK